MLLTNSMNLDYRHNKTGDLYTLLYIGNQTADQTAVNEFGQPKWVPSACYRSHATGEIFIRPLTDFEAKFTLTFPELERNLKVDLDYLVDNVLLAESALAKRRLTLLGLAKELWSLFPMIGEDVRINILRALNFTDWTNQLSQEYLESVLDARYTKLPLLFASAGATLNTGGTRAVDFNYLKEEPSNTLALLMVGLASSVREYKYMTAINVEEAEAEKHTLAITSIVEATKQTTNWFTSIGVTVALPTMPVKVNVIESVNPINSK